MWPIHSPEIRAAIVRTAAARRLPIYVHAQREDDMTVALDMGARAIVHGGFYDAAPSEDFVRRMAESGTYLMTTFSLMDAQSIGFHPERLDDPLVRGTVPARELATARDPASGRFLARAQIGMAEPLVPWFLHDLVARFMLTESHHGATAGELPARRAEVLGGRRARRRRLRLRQLADRPLPLPRNDDAARDRVARHGRRALADGSSSATRIPARMLGLADEIGTVEVGKRADLVIVRDDPLSDLRALRTIEWTIKDGIAHTPEEWMRQRAAASLVTQTEVFGG